MSESFDFDALLQLVRTLRDPRSGCSWALQQDFSSIAPHTIEEAYEVTEAIRRNDLPALKEELGDLLLQVVFHAQMADEKNAFEIADVTRSICEKLIQRNPHVFGNAGARTVAEQARAWEHSKEQERASHEVKSLMDGIPLALPELQRSIKLQRRAARVGFDWESPEQVLEKLREETAELVEATATGDLSEMEDEVGDLLFVVTNLARQLNLDPAAALRRANAKFEQRFRAMENVVGSYRQMQTMDLRELESLWQQVKQSMKRNKSRE